MKEYLNIKKASLNDLKEGASYILLERSGEKPKLASASLSDLINELSNFETTDLQTVANFKSPEWDTGSSWEVTTDKSGNQIITRKEVTKSPTKTSSRYSVGQKLKLLTGLCPTDVTVTAVKGPSRYQVQDSVLGSQLDVDEVDLIEEKL